MQIIQRFNYSNAGYYTLENDVNFVKLKLAKGRVINNPNKHMFYLSFILRGEVSAKLGDLPEAVFRAGDMMLVPKHHNVDITILEETESVILVYDGKVNISENIPFGHSRSHEVLFNFEFRPLAMRDPLYAFTNQIIKYIEDGVKSQDIQYIKTLELFFILTNYYDKEECRNFLYYTTLGSMDFYDTIFINYNKVKRIEELADLCNMSLSDFNRKFRMEFNDTPYNWILKRKSEQIKHKLRNSNIAIKSLVSEYGFSSPAHFNSFCKKQLGATPKQIRLSVEKQTI